MKIVIRNRDEGLQAINDFYSLQGTDLTEPKLLEVKRYRPPRSLPQNAKLHVMIGELADHTGYSPSELKEWLKLEYGIYQKITISGKSANIPLSTASYTKQQMAELIGHIERIGAELGFQFSEITNEAT